MIRSVRGLGTDEDGLRCMGSPFQIHHVSDENGRFSCSMRVNA